MFKITNLVYIHTDGWTDMMIPVLQSGGITSIKYIITILVYIDVILNVSNNFQI